MKKNSRQRDKGDKYIISKKENNKTWKNVRIIIIKTD